MSETRVPYGYLGIQLDPEQPLGEAILKEWRAELARGLFTLGPAVERLEQAWAKVCSTKHAIGVNSGTDALIIAMKAMGIGGPSKDWVDTQDEVMTCPNTFVATVGAIVAVGAKPVFVDSGPDYLMDMQRVGKAATRNLKAILPVDLTGNPVELSGQWLAHHRFIRDACQSIGASLSGTSSGKRAAISAYSLHPLKNVHACGDGGMIVTDNDDWAAFARLYRNHGLKDRDTVVMPGINSRLDTLQAIAGWHILQQLEEITEKRNRNAALYDQRLAGVEGVTIPPRPGLHVRQAFHTYVILVEQRAKLMAFLAERGIETKIHYPVPVHLQPGYAYLGYRRGDFPNVEYQADHQVTLPVHEFLSQQQVEYVGESVSAFYGN